jgi:AAA family ATP:ADP antiporter
LSNTAQQSLWLSTTREVKYKAKQVIDTFFKRAGDTMSGGMVWLGAHFALGAVAFLTVNVVFSLVWIGLAIALAREGAKREAAPADAGDASRSAPAARAASPGGKREAA